MTDSLAVCIIWINTYNINSLSEGIRLFEERTDFKTIPYFHFIVDSSLGKQDQVQNWVKQANQHRQPHIQLHCCDQHLGVTSKRNIAFHQIRNHYSHIIEFDDDVAPSVPHSGWLMEVIDSITQFESGGQPVYWNLNYGFDPEEFNCAGSMLSMKTREYIGDYPSQITKHYVNPIHEMDFFPYDIQKLMFEKLNIKMVGSEKISLDYNLGSIFTNFVPSFRSEMRKEQELSNEKLLQLYDDYFDAFQKIIMFSPQIFADIPLFEHECIRKTLIKNQKRQWHLPRKLYMTMKDSICLTPAEYSQFISLIQNPITHKTVTDDGLDYNGFHYINHRNETIRMLPLKEPLAFQYLVSAAKS